MWLVPLNKDYTWCHTFFSRLGRLCGHCANNMNNFPSWKFANLHQQNKRTNETSKQLLAKYRKLPLITPGLISWIKRNCFDMSYSSVDWNTFFIYWFLSKLWGTIINRIHFILNYGGGLIIGSNLFTGRWTYFVYRPYNRRGFWAGRLISGSVR